MNHALLQEIRQRIELLMQILSEIRSAQRTFLTVPQSSQYLGISKSMLYKLTSNGDIPFYKPNGKLILFLRTDLDAWVLQQKIHAPQELPNPSSSSTLKSTSYGN